MAGDGETSNGRGWMYSGWIRGKPTDEWYENTKEFLDFAFSAQGNNVVQNGKIKCPCANCRNYVTKDRDCVELDLCGYGFKRNYSVWTEHGEGRVHQTDHKKKGRTSTQLKKPPNGVRIPIEPDSDFSFKGDKSVAGQVTALLKYEYPSIIKVKNRAGVETKRHAFEWEDYCIVYPPNEQTGEISESAADRFKQEFWSIYTLVDDTPPGRLDADIVLENLARKQLKQMMYQARKEAVKMYCFIHDEPISDSEACKKKLSKPQYVEGRLEWCKDVEAWESLCAYWCSDKFDTASERGFLSRTSSLDDVAQNKGGSRNFNRTKEYIEKTFGPEQATSMNTYRFMKVGAKKYRESGSNTCIDNPRAKKRLDDYETGLKRAYPEDWQERDRDLDPAVTYSVSGGMPHGRLLIGDGSIRKSQVVVAARRSNIKPTNSMSYQDLLRRNQYLEKKNKNNSKHMKVLYINAGLPVPEDLEDDSMEDSDVNQSSPSIENGGTPLTTSSREGEETDTPLSSQNHTTRTREDSPILDE